MIILPSIDCQSKTDHHHDLKLPLLDRLVLHLYLLELP
jgi:hypothetical protein